MMSDARSEVDDARVRLLCSFVPALMLSAMSDASIEPPTTHEYEAVALFAVCALFHGLLCRWVHSHLRIWSPTAMQWELPLFPRLTARRFVPGRTFPAFLLSTSTLQSREATALAR